MGFLLQDEHLKYSVFSTVCSRCVHFDPLSVLNGQPKCKAFDQVPSAIWSGQIDHTQPYPGDSGIQFERREANET